MRETLDSIRSMLMDVTVSLIQIQQKSQKNSDQIESMQKILKILQNSTKNGQPENHNLGVKTAAWLLRPGVDLQSLNFTKSTIPIGDIISRPKARFYSGPENTGDLEYFNPDGRENPNCINLNKLSQKVRSIDLYGTCIRVYQDKFCYGRSLALYQKTQSWSSWLPSGEEDWWDIRSVGRCFENELDESEFMTDKNGIKYFRKLPVPHAHDNGTFHVPDVVVIGYTGQHYKVTPVERGKTKMSESGPIYRYRTGFEGRVEFIHAGLRSRDIIGSGEGQNGESEGGQNFYAKLDKRASDRLGYFFSPSKFKVWEEALPFFQIYPQSPQNGRMMEERENKILNHLRPSSHKTWVWITINVDYDGSNGTRPTGLSYRIGYDMLSFVTSDVYLVN